MIDIESKFDFAETVNRLRNIVSEKGLKVLAEIDHQKGAGAAGLDMHAATLVLFGNPTVGTPVMLAAPRAGLDLPLRALIWQDGDVVRISYRQPDMVAGEWGEADLPPQVAGMSKAITAILSAAAGAE